MLRAAELCKSSYDPGSRSTPGRYCRVNQFWLPGEIFGFVELDGDDAFVVFRGSDSQQNPGNWVFTNFQAYRTFFTVLDTDLKNSDRKDVQGGAYSLLDTTSARAGRKRLWRESSLFLVPFVIGLLGGLWAKRSGFIYSGVIAGLVLLLAVIGFERGTWQALMMRTKSDPPDGVPLVTLKPDLMKCRNVWFVGHSLSMSNYVATVKNIPDDDAFLPTSVN